VRIGSLLTAATLAAGALVVTPPAQAAAPAVRIIKIYYDSPGSPDLGGNRSLNGEYIQLKNMTRRAINLKGWTVSDATKRKDHVYTFKNFVLRPGKIVTLRTGKGRDTSTTVYWGRSGGTYAYIWNQVRDTAYLRDPSGSLVDTCSYNSARHDYKICWPR